MIDIIKIESDILLKETFNYILSQLKGKYYVDFQDKFPVGHDKQRLSDFLHQRDLNIENIIHKLKQGKYRFSPFIERKVPKSHKKAMILCQGCLCDVIVQMVFNKVLVENLQSYFSKGLFSGRSKKTKINIHNLIKRVYKFHKDEKDYALKLDIENYFNEIDKDILEEQVKKLFGQDSFVYKTIRSYIYSRVVVNGKVKENKKGIHIGSHLANILSNIYLTDFDKHMDEKVKFYARYADDVFVVCRDLKDSKDKLSLIKTELEKYKLRINNKKLKIVKPDQSFEYLGFEFREREIFIREKSIRKFKNKIKRILRKDKYRSLSKSKDQDSVLVDCKKRMLFLHMIGSINELICGDFYKNWVRYFSKVSFSVQFRDLDIWIRNKIRQKLSGKWSSKNYRKFPNDFFNKCGLKSLVREYYRYNEKWRLYHKPLLTRIASLRNLEKAADHHLDRSKNMKWNDFIELMSNKKKILLEIQKELLNLEYEFSKPKEKSIRRRDTKELRSIYISGLKDRVVQRAVINVISNYFDSELSEDVYSYRKGKSVFKAVSRIIRVLRNCDNRLVYKSDFKNFNECIDLGILEDKLKTLLTGEKDILNLFYKLLDSLKEIGYLPKGMPLTNFMLNIYLLDFDRRMASEFDFYIRYADDFLITVPADCTRQWVDKIIQSEASKLHLKLNKAKTKLSSQSDDFEFLGYRFGLGKKLKISLSKNAVDRVKRRVKRITHKRKYPNLTKRNYQNNQDLKNIIKKVNYYFSSKKRMSFCKYFCRVNDFGQIRCMDLWIRDRIRLAITKKMNLKNRKLISYEELNDLGLINLASWIYLAKRLMYNKIVAYQYQKTR